MDKDMSLVEFARKYHGAELHPKQVEMMESFMRGEKLTIMRPRRYGWSYANKIVRDYMQWAANSKVPTKSPTKDRKD